MTTFRALIVDKTEEEFTIGIKPLALQDLQNGEVTIRVAYSSVNYKDGLASIPNGRIVKNYPFIPGIDLSGTVVSSLTPRFREGDQVLATSYGLGVSHYGGFSEYARVPAEWVLPLPQGLTMKEAMTFGTAGFTAALSIQRLEENGLSPQKGPVLVTGATGGVGSMAVSMLAKSGYHVVASTGKSSEHEFLLQLGAKEIIDRSELLSENIPMLTKPLWAAAIDPVGGKTLAFILSAIEYGGSVAVSGLTGGTEVPATVFPFILRGINLLGIDSVNCPMDIRQALWQRMSNDLKPDNLTEAIVHEVTLDELTPILSAILRGERTGRTVVRL
jgi:putative YhdH/YhfP family quinone oxidoreductase